MDLSKLTRGQQVAFGSGVILLIAMFLPWEDFVVTRNALSAGFLSFVGWLLAFGAAVLLAVKVFSGNAVSLGNLKTEQLALVLAALGVVLILLKWIVDSGIVGYGLFIGLLAAAGVTYGSFLAMREAGLEMPDMDDFKSVAGGSDDPGDG